MDKLLLKILETALQPAIDLLKSIDSKLGGQQIPAPTAQPKPAEAVAPPAKPAEMVTEVPKNAIPVISREELGKSLIEIAKSGVDGMQKARDILSQFKAAQLADVAAADYPALAAAIKAASVVKPAPESLLG